MNNNFRFPEVVHEMRAYWLAGQTGGQLLCGRDGYCPIDDYIKPKHLLEVEFRPRYFGILGDKVYLIQEATKN